MSAVAQEIYELYRELGGIREGHYLLASGRHSPLFFQSATVMQYPKVAQRLGQLIAAQWTVPLEFVIGPAIGGIILAVTTAEALGVRALFAEKTADPQTMTIRPGLHVRPGDRFLAVEDVVTTGGSLLRAIRAAERLGAICVGAASIIDRSGGKRSFPYPLTSLLTLEVQDFDPQDCPLCLRGEPLLKI
jgi:orotate phosphoribosyltransferase